ncbi:MAG: hypothetical protein ACLPUT_00060 [Solirubrobacteraceae bacterium]
MISSEVQRTLVKSPPELWAELSDPAALARHLGELGEIRIVRTEPESTVEWAAENTTGTVSIKPSGWGTKVTLSVTRELAEQAPAPESSTEATPSPEARAEQAPALESPPETTPAPEATAEPEPTRTPEAEPAEVAEDEPAVLEAATAAEPEPAPAAAPSPEAVPASEPESESEPRRGFFARLFGRRRAAPPPVAPAGATTVELPADPSAQTVAAERLPGQSDAFAAVRQALAPDTFAAEHPFAALPPVEPAPKPAAFEPMAPEPAVPEPAAPEPAAPDRDAQAEQASNLSAELLAAEEVTAEEVTAVLTAVLDRLGAAHHRPFSRS